MKKLFPVFLTLIVFLALPTPAFAKRLIPRLQKTTTTSTTARTTSTTKGVTTSVKFRADRRAIVVNFQNLSIAKSVSYTLSYNSRGTTQGAGGAISTAENNQTREIIFGTCSHGVCRYDSGITNAKFAVTTTLTNGKKIVKTFRLKI